ncbi:hypothetical protein D6779_11125 [Candidatus Parcubacteria bacterium]|nr:MAG: hypothetical protein D6779_11125 [Candidatus Parcubacteria bacterium]
MPFDAKQNETGWGGNVGAMDYRTLDTMEANPLFKSIKSRIETFDSMVRTDPKISGIWHILRTLAVRAVVSGGFVEEGDRAAARRFVKQFATDNELFDFVETAVNYWIYGFYPFEVIAVPNDGDFVLDARPRHPRSVYGWRLSSDGRRIEAMIQRPNPSGGGSMVDIPYEALLIFSNQSHPLNPEGVSSLRSVYPYWLIKQKAVKAMGINISRFGVGVPRIKVNRNTSRRADVIARAEEIGKNLRNSEIGYVVDIEGETETELLSNSGAVSNLQHIMNAVKYYDSQIISSMVSGFLSGTTSSSARGVVGFFISTAQGVADYIARRLSALLAEAMRINGVDSGGRLPTYNTGSVYSYVYIPEVLQSVAQAWGQGALSEGPQELVDFIEENVGIKQRGL